MKWPETFHEEYPVFEFTTIDEFWSAGWTWGFNGDPKSRMVAAFQESLGKLTGEQIAALNDGYAMGISDKVGHVADMVQRVTESRLAESKLVAPF